MATVGKKYTSPDKWETAWFARLSPGKKILYCYMWDRCDHAGVLEFIPPVWSAHIGHKIGPKKLKEFIAGVNKDTERVARFGDKIWLTQYIRFNQQPDNNKSLSSNHHFHRKVVRLLKGHNLYDEAKKRDPVLLKAFDEQSSVSSESKPSPSLKGGLPKGKSRSRKQVQVEVENKTSGRPPVSQRETSKERRTTDDLINEVDQAINGIPSLPEDNLVDELKKIIPARVLKDVHDIALTADIKVLAENLKDKVDNPDNFIKTHAQRIEEWNLVSYADFIESFENGELENAPF